MVGRITDISIPPVLFKYRDWNNKFHRKIITNGEIYFPKPSDFNDPFDGNIPVRWDKMSYEDCFEKNLELVKSMGKGQTEKQLKAMTKKLTDDKTFWHPDSLSKERPEQLKKWDSIIGLFSLSELKDNILMWSHYAAFHTGFLVGFDSTSLVSEYDFDYAEPIQYKKDYPFISGFDDATIQFYKKFFFKSSDWKYEKEWRISKNHIENRTVKLKKDTISQIIIGCRMINTNKVSIIKKSKKCLGMNIPIYIATKHEEDFKLNFERIN